MPSKKRSFKDALTSTIRSEKSSVEKRIEKADQAFLPKPIQRAVIEETPAELAVRDNFSMPASDYAIIAELRQRCLKSGVSVTKSEVVRAGLHALEELRTEELLKVLSNLEKLKPGKRPRAA
jgi:hypothetical protein